MKNHHNDHYQLTNTNTNTYKGGLMPLKEEILQTVYSKEKAVKIKELRSRIEVLEEQDFTYLDMTPMREGELKDLVLRGQQDPWHAANINSYRNGFDQMNWGYQGDGPHTLAMSVLAHFTGGDLAYAWSHFYLFTGDFLIDFDRSQSRLIPKEVILDWIGLSDRGRRALKKAGLRLEGELAYVC